MTSEGHAKGSQDGKRTRKADMTLKSLADGKSDVKGKSERSAYMSSTKQKKQTRLRKGMPRARRTTSKKKKQT